MSLMLERLLSGPQSQHVGGSLSAPQGLATSLALC